MKQFLPFLLTLLVSAALQGQSQLTILLVDDSKDDFDNTAAIANALTQGGYTFDVVNSPETTAGPTAADMAMYQLVIWHTSTDGVDLDLWARTDSDNAEIAAYLAGGGNLWLMGNDFMFDRYGAPMDDFAEGDFAYDFLGIAQYTAQAFGDDGGLGVPAMAPSDGQPMTGLEDITWQFSTLWWADVLTGRDEAVSIYDMSGAGYVFDGQTAGLWYDNGTSICLTFGFDLSLAGNQSMIDNTVDAVLTFWEAALLSNQTEVPAALTDVNVFPNPTTTRASLSLKVVETADVQIDVLNAVGQHVATVAPLARLLPDTYTFDWTPASQLPSGNYHFRVSVDGAVLTRTVVWVQE
jgi:hypothetical protein